MLGSIKGTITHKDDKYILVENAGLGYRVYVYGDTLLASTVGQDIHLFLYTHVREDAFDLYGFPSMPELSFFELLITVSGIGPRGALGILSVASVESLRRAIKSSDTGYLTKISGIGKKTAEKIALELRDKITGVVESDTTDNLDALEALQALGYRENDIREALRAVDPKDPTNTKIKEALKFLSDRKEMDYDKKGKTISGYGDDAYYTNVSMVSGGPKLEFVKDNVYYNLGIRTIKRGAVDTLESELMALGKKVLE